ncbi:hypothetical protein ACIQ6K_18750 [Streptomyces sp. NPDC096354]
MSSSRRTLFPPLTALRPGTVTLPVTVNGTTQRTQIHIAAAAAASAA